MTKSELPHPDRFAPGPVILFMLFVFFNFISRGVFSPLLPTIEADFGISHAKAGNLFLIMMMGFSSGTIVSGFVAKPLHHRGTVLLSLFLIGVSMVLCAASSSFLLFRVFICLLGISAGLYAPSGLASITDMTHRNHWGKAIAIHEVGPNLGFILAPLVVNLVLPVFTWRILLIGLGVVDLVYVVLYLFIGNGGRFAGEPPHFENLKPIFKNYAFWLLAFLYILGAGSAFGIYSILPTYLITERGLEANLVNTVVGLSKVAGIGMVFLSGFLIDRMGIKRLLFFVIGLAALFAVLLGVLSGVPLILMVLLQPTIISAFFPVGNSAITRLTNRKTRNLAFSLIIPFAAAFGGGLTPSFLGFMGDRFSFATGLIILGIITVAGLAIIPLINIPEGTE